MIVDVQALTAGEPGHDTVLEPGAIVGGPRSVVGDVTHFFKTVATILTPFVMAMSGIVLGPSVEAVLTGKAAASQVPVVIGP